VLQLLAGVWSFVLALNSLPFPSALFEQARQPLSRVKLPAQIESLSARACQSCHTEVYKQWLGSRHAKSATNRIFAASFRREPLRWCVYCHAPLPEQDAALQNVRLVRPGIWPIVDEGVNCAVCHVRDGAILVARSPSPAAQRAHPVRVVAELRQASFCGGCHQFNFPRPGMPIHYTAEPMQDTLSEWRRTTQEKSCQDCHMPRGTHGFPGGHDSTLLRDTLSAEVTRQPAGHLRIELRARAAGHRVPTGDPFRQLQVKLYAEKDDAAPLRTYAFGRRFRNPPGGAPDTWVLARDMSIPPPEKGREAVRTLDLKNGDVSTVKSAKYWRLLLSYPAPSSVPDLRGDDLAIEVTRGVVTPPP